MESSATLTLSSGQVDDNTFWRNIPNSLGGKQDIELQSSNVIFGRLAHRATALKQFWCSVSYSKNQCDNVLPPTTESDIIQLIRYTLPLSPSRIPDSCAPNQAFVAGPKPAPVVSDEFLTGASARDWS
ncbi:hypothetical protein An13g02520 [Aspergillus niger]|uniref:Uncharacterized protein n=2 Tax=Aspergillus niger TaxID=5061 RepID=A2R1U9_ASPNC|nr:hypothetical protein An13g02520 [Aspergillus niger]CAK41649.1 hypothetical protein An13g02520 [Aspergillus niger]